MESRKNEMEELYTDHQKAILATWLGHVAIENSRNLDSSSTSFIFAWSKKMFSWYKTILSIKWPRCLCKNITNDHEFYYLLMYLFTTAVSINQDLFKYWLQILASFQTVIVVMIINIKILLGGLKGLKKLGLGATPHLLKVNQLGDPSAKMTMKQPTQN